MKSVKKAPADLSFLDEREHFIPIRAAILLDRLTAGRNAAEARHLQALWERLANRFHFDYRQICAPLRDIYAPLDPDRDTLCEPTLCADERSAAAQEVFGGIVTLLERCNFRSLSRDQLNECLRLQPMGGLAVRVDTEEFSAFEVRYRGVRDTQIPWPKWQIWRRDKTRPTKILKKVFVLARQKEEAGGRLILKLFKDVPVENLKIIAPKITLGLPIFDRLKIGSTVAGGLVTSAAKLVMAAAFSWWLFFLFLFGFILALVKGVFGFLHSRTKYMQICASSLYYQSLSNNVGAVSSLAAMAEDQEVKETLLAYEILRRNEGLFLTERQLDAAVEKWLVEEFTELRDVDFESNDAVRKVVEKRLAEVKNSPDAHPTYRAFDLETALDHLRQDWASR